MYWLAGVIGIFALVAPFVFHYAENVPFLWVSVVSAIVFLSIATEHLFYGQNSHAFHERRSHI